MVGLHGTVGEIKLMYRIVPKTTPRYMKFSQIKIRAIHKVLLFLMNRDSDIGLEYTRTQLASTCIFHFSKNYRVIKEVMLNLRSRYMKIL